MVASIKIGGSVPPKRPALAKPGDPLVTGKGEVVDEANPEHDSADPSNNPENSVRPRDYRPTNRRSIADLPAEPRSFNLVSVVLFYTLCGIPDLQISEAIGVELDHIKKVRDSDAYTEAFNMVMSEFINVNSEMIECRIAAYSRGALTKVSELSEKAKKESVQLSASKDILDRGGYRPQDQLGKGGPAMNELRIVISTDDGDNVNLNFNGENF